MTLATAHPHEIRAIKRLWAKGETFGLTLTVRGQGARDKMTLPLEPERVKAEWVASASTNPWTKARNFAINLGMSDASFMSWFEKAAPDHFEELLEQLQAADQPRERDSQSLVRWLSVRTEPIKSKADPLAHIDWAVFEAVYLRDRAPVTTAYTTAGGKSHQLSAEFVNAAVARGIDLELEPMTASDPEWWRSVRAFLWAEQASSAKDFDTICFAQGVSEAAMSYRLGKSHLRRYGDRERVREIVRRWDKGASVKELAEHFDVQQQTIENRIASCAPRSSDNLKVNIHVSE